MLTPDADRRYSPFKRRAGDGSYRRIEMPFSETLNLLERELEFLGANHVVFQVALDEADFRLNGEPRAHARARHPGVVVAFDSIYGPLKYATDTFTTWQANVRAIALGLEALRKVDRYGITKRGEQYTGWKALPPGTGLAPSHMTPEEAARWISMNSGADDPTLERALLTNVEAYRNVVRRAIKRLHPDTGGDRALWDKLQVAKAILDRHHGLLREAEQS